MSDQRSRIQQRQKALLDAIGSMDTEREIGDEWCPDEDVVQALFMQEVERERAERLSMHRVSQAAPGRRLLALLRQPMPTIPPNLLMSVNIPEYEKKEE